METRERTCSPFLHFQSQPGVIAMKSRRPVRRTSLWTPPLPSCIHGRGHPAAPAQYTHKYSTYRVAQHHHIFITRTRVGQEVEGSGLHIQLSSTCHVSFFAAPDTDHNHQFSLILLIYLSYLSDSLTNTQDLWYSIHIYPAMFHGRVADQHKFISHRL